MVAQTQPKFPHKARTLRHDFSGCRYRMPLRAPRDGSSQPPDSKQTERRRPLAARDRRKRHRAYEHPSRRRVDGLHLVAVDVDDGAQVLTRVHDVPQPRPGEQQPPALRACERPWCQVSSRDSSRLPFSRAMVSRFSTSDPCPCDPILHATALPGIRSRLPSTSATSGSSKALQSTSSRRVASSERQSTAAVHLCA